MFHSISTRRIGTRAGTSLLAVAATTFSLLVFASPMAAQSGTTLEVMNNPNNPSGCPGGSMGYKLGAGQLSRDGSFRQYHSADGAFTIQISSPADRGEAMSLSFHSANADVVLVRVKGASGSNGGGNNDYWFNPAADAASGLTAPLNGNTPTSGDTFAISHVIFCMQTVVVSTNPPSMTEPPIGTEEPTVTEPPTGSEAPSVSNPPSGTNPPTGGISPGTGRPPTGGIDPDMGRAPTGGISPGTGRPGGGIIPNTATGMEISINSVATLLSLIVVIGSLGWLGAAQLKRSGTDGR